VGGQHAAVVEHGGRHSVGHCPRLGGAKPPHLSTSLLDIILEIGSNSFRLQFLASEPPSL
jgi:hypothetical protein